MYYKPTVTEYRPEDIPSLKRLWSEVFGDPDELIDRFFELLPSMGTCFIAECEGELVSAAYLLRSELWEKGKYSKKLAYLYAVATEPEARGFGIASELVRSCRRFCWENGIDICCTLPAEQSLYSWYEKSAGFLPADKCVYNEVFASDAPCDIKELFADEYGFMRSEMLKDKNYVNYYYAWLLFAEAIFKTYGGGFYACGGSIACGYIEGDTLLIKELIGDCPEFIPALCKKLGAKKALICRISSCGEDHIATFEPNEYPADTVFGLTLD